MKKVVVPLILLLAAGCGYKKIPTTKQERIITEKTQVHFPKPVNLTASEQEVAVKIKQAAEHGLTRGEMIQLALANNNTLQGEFTKLGVVKSDLVQAGFYTNPNLSTIFYFQDKSPKVYVSAGVSVTLSDLWQLPLRVRVAQDDLAIATQKVLQTVRDTIFDTKSTYNKCLYAHARYEVTSRILKQMTDLHATITAHYSAPQQQQVANTPAASTTPTAPVKTHTVAERERDYDIALSTAMLLQWQQKEMAARNDLTTCHGEIKRALSLPIISPDIKLLEPLHPIKIVLPELKDITDFALKNRPELQIAQMKVQQAEHALQLQQSKVWDNVQVGFYASGNDDGSYDKGLSISCNPPFFDGKQGALSRSSYLIDTAKADYRDIKVNVDTDIYVIYHTLLARMEQLRIYPDIIASYKKAVDQTGELARHSNAPVLHLYQTLVFLYDAELNALALMFQIAQGLAELEKAVGKQLIG